jgi:hypothetical protein
VQRLLLRHVVLHACHAVVNCPGCCAWPCPAPQPVVEAWQIMLGARSDWTNQCFGQGCHSASLVQEAALMYKVSPVGRLASVCCGCFSVAFVVGCEDITKRGYCMLVAANISRQQTMRSTRCCIAGEFKHRKRLMWLPQDSRSLLVGSNSSHALPDQTLTCTPELQLGTQRLTTKDGAAASSCDPHARRSASTYAACAFERMLLPCWCCNMPT